MTDLRKLPHGRECAERWRPVRDWEGLYEVSDLGNVRSVARWVSCREGKRLSEGRILQPGKSLGKYWKVELSDGSRHASVHIHRLVAIAFVMGVGAHVRHLDGNGFNNCVDNLAWGSPAENEADKLRHGRRPIGEKHHNSRITEQHVRTIRSLHERGFTQLAIAAHLGLNRGVVGTVVRREGWTHVT